jgi:hypothetical protein
MGAVVRIEVFQGDVVILGAPGVDDFPGTPFAMAAGSTTISLAAVAFNSVAISFPAGRFSQPPIVTVTKSGVPAGEQKLIPVSTTITTSGCSLRVDSGDGTAVTVTGLGLHWVAVQMISTNAAG